MCTTSKVNLNSSNFYSAGLGGIYSLFIVSRCRKWWLTMRNTGYIRTDFHILQGMGVLTFFEIFYFLTIRLRVNYIQIRNQRRTLRLNAKTMMAKQRKRTTAWKQSQKIRRIYWNFVACNWTFNQSNILHSLQAFFVLFIRSFGMKNGSMKNFLIVQGRRFHLMMWLNDSNGPVC